MERLNKAINDKLQELQESKISKLRLEELDSSLKKSKTKLSSFQQAFSESAQAIAILEKKSILNRVKTFFLSGKADLEKERQVYLDLNNKINQQENEITILDYEQEVLVSKYRGVATIEKELQDLIGKKYFNLKSSNTSFSKELFVKESEIGRFKLMIQKVNTALKRGEIVLKQIAILKHELDSTQQSMENLEASSSVRKRRYINISKSKLVTALARLEEYKNSIDKIDSTIGFDHSLDKFDYFLSIYASEYLTQKVVEESIVGSQQEMNLCLSEIKRIEIQLLEKRKEAIHKLEEKEKLLQLFIMEF